MLNTGWRRLRIAITQATARVACLAVVSAGIGLAIASPSGAIFPSRPREEVSVLGNGVVWFDEGVVSFNDSRGGTLKLGAAGGTGPPQVASSSDTVAWLAGEDALGFMADVPPRSPEHVAQPMLTSGGGCKGWQPGTEAVKDFVVAEQSIVAAAECHWDDRAFRQPLYIRDVDHGRWRVLRWLPGDAEPILASAGDLIAVGIERSIRRMEVLIIDVTSGRVDTQFDSPTGYLAFASSDRLVVSTPQTLSSPAGPGIGTQWSGPFDIFLYATNGKRLSALGSSSLPPAVSGMHFVTYENGEVDVKSAASGAARPVVGFAAPARVLDTFGFRWPQLALVESTSTPILSSEIRCGTGEYGPESKPALNVLDLAQNSPFLPAPAVVHVQPSHDCGPAPP